MSEQKPAEANIATADDLTKAKQPNGVHLTEADLSKVAGGIDGESNDDKFKNQIQIL